MTDQTTLTDQQLAGIEARVTAALHCPNAEANGRLDGQHTLSGSFSHIRCELCTYTRPRGERVEETAALLAYVRRLRTAAAAELLPAWEAMYEPGNVSDYLIGYANSEAAAKGAAEAWMRSQSEVTGRLEWVLQNSIDGYDSEFELIQRHDDGVDTGPGIVVRRRVATPAPAVSGGEQQ